MVYDLTYQPDAASGGRRWLEEDRLITTIRLILAISLWVITIIDFPRTAHSVPLIETIVLSYVLYCLVLRLPFTRQIPLVVFLDRHGHWADGIMYSLLIALTGGLTSIFFTGYYFCLASAAFRWGFLPGLRLAVVLALIYTAIIFLDIVIYNSPYEVNRMLLRPTLLLLIGYIMAWWGESEIRLKRRLALLKDIAPLSNPCFGIDRTLSDGLERLRVFFDADRGLLVMQQSSASGHELRTAGRKNANEAMTALLLSEAFCQKLLALPPPLAAMRIDRGMGMTRCHTYDAVSEQEVRPDRQQLDDLAELLEIRSFLTVPVRYLGRFTGRLYITCPPKQKPLDMSDLRFLMHVMDQFVPLIQNARLVDRLACDAAEDERKRIACDIHDNVIQPYIGIQMSIAALKQKLVSGEGDIRPLLDKLDGMVDEGLGDLRRYIHGLDDSSRVGGSLLPAIRRFAARFSEATGIEVQVESGGELPAGRKLHGELFQMASEGLSNIHKHTAATRAIIRVIASENGVSLEIENNGIQEAAAAEFMPHTIAWRAKALGGEIRIEQCSSDSCRVVVQVPR